MTKTLAQRRADPDWRVRLLVTQADVKAGRDLAWARADPDWVVRWAAARADAKARR